MPITKTTFSGKTKTKGRQERLVSIKIFPNSSSAASYTTQGGATAARSAAGKFLITGVDNFPRLVSFQATHVDVADNVDLYAQGGVVANLGSASLPWTAYVKLKTGATNTDAGAADADRYISVDLRFEDTVA